MITKLFREENNNSIIYEIKKELNNMSANFIGYEKILRNLNDNNIDLNDLSEFDLNQVIRKCIYWFKKNWNNKYLFLPTDARYEIESWKIINKSPYSNSFYNTKNIDWDYKEEGSLRLSDHWNFTINDKEQHCKLRNNYSYRSGKFILAQYHKGYYDIIKEYDNEE
jgi:hypothetical protein